MLTPTTRRHVIPVMLMGFRTEVNLFGRPSRAAKRKDLPYIHLHPSSENLDPEMLKLSPRPRCQVCDTLPLPFSGPVRCVRHTSTRLVAVGDISNKESGPSVQRGFVTTLVLHQWEWGKNFFFLLLSWQKDLSSYCLYAGYFAIELDGNMKIRSTSEPALIKVQWGSSCKGVASFVSQNSKPNVSCG